MSRLLSGVSLSKDEQDKMKKKIREMNDPLEEYAELIAPNLVGIKEKKKVILLCLASLFDNNDHRWRIHSILHGPPGTGKSKLLTWLRDNLNIGFAGKKTTEAGLVGSMKGSGKKGKLPKNHMGILAVDELDKMPKTDRDGLLEAMSDGKVTMTGGDVDKNYDANTIVLAAINTMGKLDEKIMSRFDFQVRFSRYNRETGEEILKSWGKNLTDEEKVNKLKKYLKTVRSFEPDKKTDSGYDIIKWLWKEHNVSEIEPRQHIERFNRVAVAHARLNLRNPQEEDFWKAAEILMQDSYPELERMVNESG